MGEPMRFAGKVDGWYYALTVGVNVMLAWPLASFFADPAKEGAFISAVVCLLCLVLCDIFITPTLVLDGDHQLLVADAQLDAVERRRQGSQRVGRLAQPADLRDGIRRLLEAEHDEQVALPVELDVVAKKEEFFAEIERRCPQVEIVRRASVSKSR